MLIVKGIFGVIAGTFCYLIGGWDSLAQGVIGMVGLDFLVGVLSRKARGIELDPDKAVAGLIRKLLILIGIIGAVLVDRTIDVDGQALSARTIYCIAFMGSESLSFFRNLADAGLKIPAAIINRVQVFADSVDEKMKGGGNDGE